VSAALWLKYEAVAVLFIALPLALKTRKRWVGDASGGY
jgi:hypothetical protein